MKYFEKPVRQIQKTPYLELNGSKHSSYLIALQRGSKFNFNLMFNILHDFHEMLVSCIRTSR